MSPHLPCAWWLVVQPSPVPPPVLGRACRDKWVREFNYLRAQAVEPLATFLEFIT